jgi:hypothetical protein
MFAQPRSAYRDYGFLALGFSVVPLIEMVSQLSRHPMSLHSRVAISLACGVATGPLIVMSLMARTSWIHRLFLVLGATAMVGCILMLTHR